MNSLRVRVWPDVVRLATFILSLATVAGVLFVYMSVDGLRRALEGRPEVLALATGPGGPLEVDMRNIQPCPVLRKKIGEGQDSYEVEFPCCRNDGEATAEWGARCRMEFAEFCKGLEGG